MFNSGFHAKLSKVEPVLSVQLRRCLRAVPVHILYRDRKSFVTGEDRGKMVRDHQ